MVDGKAQMQLDFNAKINQGTIHILTHIIQVGETTQISDGEIHNNLPNNLHHKGDFNKTHLDSRDHTNPTNHHRPKTTQVRFLIILKLFNC